MERSAVEIVLFIESTQTVYFRYKNILYKAKLIKEKGNETRLYVFNLNKTFDLQHKKPALKKSLTEIFSEDIFSPISGRIVKICKAVGSEALKDEPLLVIESMKMENEISAPADLFVKTIHIKAGDLVKQDQLLMKVRAK